MELESNKASRSAPVLPWMKRPIAVEEHALQPVSGMRGLDDRIRGFLTDKMGINDIFSIQMAVWELMCGGESRQHDVCFSAPTGSGKTLAYALPIVNALAIGHGGVRIKKNCVGIQCLIVVPTRGLAMQVYSVVQPLADAVGLATLGVCGSMTVAEEASILAERNHDICIFTPGRLVSHLEATVGFSEGLKRNVSFLVIDEADRLLRQRYNDWLPKVLDCIDSSSLVKYVVSATLTRDPTKLDVLRLVAPRCVTHVQGTHNVLFASDFFPSILFAYDDISIYIYTGGVQRNSSTSCRRCWRNPKSWWQNKTSQLPFVPC